MSREKTNNSKKPHISFRDLQDKIEDCKQKRDDLNKKTKDYIKRLQEIDNEIVEYLNVAKKIYKKKRDYWNLKVGKLKEKKIEYKELLDSLIGEKRNYLKANGINKGKKQNISIKTIERKIEGLERKIETDALDIEEENAIVDKIKELAGKKEELLAERKNDDFYRLERKIEIVKINLNKIYEQLNKWSDKSQTNHSKMIDLYDQVNELRENKKSMEEDLIENKKSADQYHEQYLQLMSEKKKRNFNQGKRPYKPRTGQGKRPARQRFRAKGNDNNNKELLEKINREKLATALEKQKAGRKLSLYEAKLILENNTK